MCWQITESPKKTHSLEGEAFYRISSYCLAL